MTTNQKRIFTWSPQDQETPEWRWEPGYWSWCWSTWIQSSWSHIVWCGEVGQSWSATSRQSWWVDWSYQLWVRWTEHWAELIINFQLLIITRKSFYINNNYSIQILFQWYRRLWEFEMIWLWECCGDLMMRGSMSGWRSAGGTVSRCCPAETEQSSPAWSRGDHCAETTTGRWRDPAPTWRGWSQTLWPPVNQSEVSIVNQSEWSITLLMQACTQRARTVAMGTVSLTPAQMLLGRNCLELLRHISACSSLMHNKLYTSWRITTFLLCSSSFTNTTEAPCTCQPIRD